VPNPFAGVICQHSAINQLNAEILPGNSVVPGNSPENADSGSRRLQWIVEMHKIAQSQ
jgi:hypothetical protein